MGRSIGCEEAVCAGLRQQFSDTNQAVTETAGAVVQQAQVALDQVRQLSRGLFPFDLEPDGLLPALRDLASTTEAFHKIRVHVVGEVPRSIRDSRVATQLYRIVQEAVTNAAKHSKASTITIEITGVDEVVIIRVVDDGIGIQTQMTKNDGLGLRIMRYRASSIGALLTIDAAPGGGTKVVCTWREPSTVPAVSS